MRIFLAVLGWLCVALGFIGALLPLLPTTPFLLLAMFLFAHSSPRFRTWLIGHRILGPYLAGYTSKLGLPIRTKVVTLLMMWTSMICAVLWATDMLWLRIVLVVIAIGVSIHILLKPTCKGGKK